MEEEEPSVLAGAGTGAQSPARVNNKAIAEQAVVERLLKGADIDSQIAAAKEIRKLVRKSKSSSKIRCRLAAAGVISPLVSMLHLPSACESALLALLNLAVRDESNKIKIVMSGAVPPLVELLKLQNANLRDLATAAILTLSAAASNNPTIAAAGVGPHLVQMLSSGSVQGRVDAVTALYNLSTSTEGPKLAINPGAVPPLIGLLKECKKYSKFAEKTTALLEILSNSEEGKTAITNTKNGILTLVETVEDGSAVSTEHAVGVLLSLCQSSRDKYRMLILKEGAIPGLLRLTAEGTAKAQESARTLLDLLREPPQEKRVSSFVIERIVYGFANQVDVTDTVAETAKRFLQDMVHRNMELSMSHIQASPPCVASKVSSV